MKARAILSAGVMFLTGCATMQSCPASVDQAAQLQCQAAQGSKLAQLELAKMYEDGRGVPQDYRRAADLYRKASRTTSGTVYVYSPKVGKAPAQVLPVRSGPDIPGSPEAMYRLGLMYRDGRGVPRDIARGERLISNAIAAGFQIPKG